GRPKGQVSRLQQESLLAAALTPFAPGDTIAFMRLLAVLGCLCQLGLAQLGGTIQGRVVVSTGNVPAASVRARNLKTGDVRETKTSAKGEYTPVVPAGTFDFFIVKAPYGAFTQRQLVVPAGATLKVDAKLAEGLNVGTPGEFAYLILRDRTNSPKGPAP